MRTPLGQYVGSRMYYGIKTGLNEAFVVDQATRDRLVAEAPRSAEVLRPYLRGHDINRYAIHPARLWLIRIENGWTNASMGAPKGKTPEDTAWKHFRQAYPAIAAHLAPFADRCRKRDDQGHYWWELRPCDYYAAFERPKIVYPDIAPGMEFTWDTTGSYLGNTNYSIATTVPYLCALLNSSMMARLYGGLTQMIRGGYFRIFTQYVGRLPIVEPSAEDQARLAELVGALQVLGGAGPGAALEAEVDAIVYRVYGLTADEGAEVERWHAVRRALVGAGRKGGQAAGAQPEEVAQKEEREEA